MNSIKGKILVVDDNMEMRNLLEDYLKSEGHQVTTHSSASEALSALDTLGSLDLIISDIRMPQMDGLEFTSRIKALRPDVPVILITAFGSVETALEAMKRGAYHYLVKPFKLAEVSVQVERALTHRRLEQDNSALRDTLKGKQRSGQLIGKSAQMRQVFDLIDRVSHATTNILITGESGTGKELVARAIHEQSTRKNQPFIAINCTAIPENLLESELFGHAKGSFTGAIQRKKGLFEEATGGTLLLDEIGDMPPPLQSKLLRALQEKTIRPVGDNVDIPIDVRIISATHKDLKAAIRDGRFREDLYYRLSVIPIMIPPLRQRTDDIPILAEHFLRKHAAANQSRVRGFSDAALRKLTAMKWEGNVRELENAIERAVVLCQNEVIDVADLPGAELPTAERFFEASTVDYPTIEQLEKRYINLILEVTAGRKDKASQILGINRRTLYRKEREYDLLLDKNEVEPEDSPIEASELAAPQAPPVFSESRATP